MPSRVSKLLLLSSAILTAHLIDAAAQQQVTPTWLVACDNRATAKKLACAMTQTVANAQSGQRVLTVRISNIQGADTVFFALPHGLDLTSGVEFWVDEGERTRSIITTADANGSYADAELTDQQVTAMKEGSQLNVEIVTANGQPTKLQLSLAGFFDAYLLVTKHGSE